MHDLTPITALGGTVPRVNAVGRITLTEIFDLALATVAEESRQEETCRKQLANLP